MWPNGILWRGAEYPSNTKSPGPRTTSIPSGILIHPAVWPQWVWAKNGGSCAPLGEGELGPHLTQCVQAKAYQHAKFHLHPSNYLATIHQRYIQVRQAGRQDNGWSDSTGRTVLQTVTQKTLNLMLVADLQRAET